MIVVNAPQFVIGDLVFPKSYK